MERRLTHGLCGICGRAMILQGACTSKAEASQELRIHVNCPPDPRMKMRALAVLGVNTGVGKTHVSTLILRGLRKVRDLDVLPFKPLESGVEAHGGVPQDAARLLKASGLAAALEDVCPWQLPRPVAPADELERLDLRVSLKDIQGAAESLLAKHATRYLLFEGAGGVLSPLTWKIDATDVATTLRAGVWLVAKDELGALSQIRTSLESLERRKLPVLGVILNRFTDEQSIEKGKNAAALQRLGISKVWTADQNQVAASVIAESSVWYRQG